MLVGMLSFMPIALIPCLDLLYSLPLFRVFALGRKDKLCLTDILIESGLPLLLWSSHKWSLI